MQTATSRETMEAADLELPECLIPRPGDSVVWFQEGNQWHGEFQGITESGNAVLKWPSGFTTENMGLASIRVASRKKAVGPMWLPLQPGSIFRPTAEESMALSVLTSQQVNRGPSPKDLAVEIWERGFEVFFTGESVRRALMSQDMVDSELITTMPKNWLRILLKDMYAGKNSDDLIFERNPDRFRVGEIVGNPNAYAYVRLFRSAYRDDHHIYGASFEGEISFNDFTFNAIYFDPKNEVLIDPTGDGLDDVFCRCLRPLEWSPEIPQEAKDAIGLGVLRFYLEGCALCPGTEGMLLKFVRGLARLQTEDLASALYTEVFAGRDDLDAYSLKIRDLLEDQGMPELWLRVFQPAILKAKEIAPNGGVS